MPPDPLSVREARELVRSACWDWDVGEDACEDAAFVISELVSTVFDHPHTPCLVRISRGGGRLRIEVEDFNAPTVPRLLPLDMTRRSRRHGLRVVDGLTESWGMTRRAGGRCVWAVVPTG